MHHLLDTGYSEMSRKVLAASWVYWLMDMLSIWPLAQLHADGPKASAPANAPWHGL